jgi:predicted dehydrogenase
MSKLRLIQCGMGGMGKTWWTNATGNSADFDLAAIVDVADAPLNESGDALNIPRERRFKSLSDAIKAIPADAVLTVTPPAIHVQHAELAFANGLHLMTEKPIADTLENARRMVMLARNGKKQLVVTQNYRYSAQAQKMKELFTGKSLGDFGHGHLDFYIAADFTGSFREAMEYPLLVDMAIHHFDLIRHVTGKNVTKVLAHTFKPSWSWYQHHPGLKMLLELEDNIPFTYTGDWSAKGRQTGWNGTWRLQFAEGSLHWEKDGIVVERCERWGKNPTTEKIDAPNLLLNGQAQLLANFASAICSNTPAETSGEDNLWSFGAVMAAVQSAKTNCSVNVTDFV